MKGNMTTLNNEQKSLVEGLFAHYKKDELTRSEINDYIVDNKIKNPSWLKSNTYKIARGVYRLPINGDISPVVSEPVSTKTEIAPAKCIIQEAKDARHNKISGFLFIVVFLCLLIVWGQSLT